MPVKLIENPKCESFTSIKMIGVGGCGGNFIEHVIRGEESGVEVVFMNTNAEALARRSMFNCVQIGSSGLSALGHPERSRNAVVEAEGDIRAALNGATMIFIVAGMGGGTGTGAAPAIGKVAKEMGIFSVGLVTMPFRFEGRRRISNAIAGLIELKANVDLLIELPNERLLEVSSADISQDEAFAYINELTKNVVIGLHKILNVSALNNVRYEDVRLVMGQPGWAAMGSAQASGSDRASIATEQALSCPMFEGVELSVAKGVLVIVASGRGAMLEREVELVLSTIRACFSPKVHMVYGTTFDDTLGDNLRVTLVASGMANRATVRSLKKTFSIPAMGGGKRPNFY
jgi:cell division protein FtsZ